MMINRNTLLLTCSLALLSLGACSGGSNVHKANTQLELAQGEVLPDRETLIAYGFQIIMDQRANTPHIDDEHHSDLYYERQYKQDPTIEANAIAYTQSLLRDDNSARALLIITPFGQRTDASQEASTLLAQALLEDNNIMEARKTAMNAIAMNPDEAEKAYHILALTYQAQGLSQEANETLLQALYVANKNPAPIMNSIALNDAIMGYPHDALALLQKLTAAAPQYPSIRANRDRLAAFITQNNHKRETRKTPPIPKRKQ